MDDIMTTKPVDFVRKETRENRLSSKDVNASAAVNTFRERRERKKSRFPAVFWLKSLIKK